MQIEFIREFIKLARRLNITSTAREMNLSQSSMSRHIQAMEKELHAELVERNGSSLALTRAGEAFLEGMIPLITLYDRTVSQCRSLSKHDLIQLRIQDVPIRSESSTILFDLVVEFSKQHSDVRIDYTPLSRYTPREALSRGLFDIVQTISAGSQKEAMEHFEQESLQALPIVSEQPLIWVDKRSRLYKKESITLDDLKNIKFCVSAGKLNDPMGEVIKELGNKEGFSPVIRSGNAASMAEFFLWAGDSGEDSVVLLTPGSTDDVRLRSYAGRAFRTIDDNRARLTTYLLARDDAAQSVVAEFMLFAQQRIKAMDLPGSDRIS